MWAPLARDENRCEIAKSFFLLDDNTPAWSNYWDRCSTCTQSCGSFGVGIYKIEEAAKEHSHQLVEKISSILRKKSTFSILHYYFYKTPTSVYLFYKTIQ